MKSCSFKLSVSGDDLSAFQHIFRNKITSKRQHSFLSRSLSLHTHSLSLLLSFFSFSFTFSFKRLHKVQLFPWNLNIFSWKEQEHIEVIISLTRFQRTNKTPKVWKTTDPYKTLQGTLPGYVDNNDGWGKENGQMIEFPYKQTSVTRTSVVQCVVITQAGVGNLVTQLPSVCLCSCKECATQTSVSRHNEVTDSSSFCGIVYCFIIGVLSGINRHFFTHPMKNHKTKMTSKQKLRESRMICR